MHNFYFKETDNKVIITKELNKEYVDSNFWNNGIERINAIAGKNGTGKTSLLRYISKHDNLFKECIFVIQSKENIRFFNMTECVLDYDFDAETVNNLPDDFKVFYYSPILDNELRNTYSRMNLSNYFNGNLAEYQLNLLEVKGMYKI